jgi:uncharacterized protein
MASFLSPLLEPDSVPRVLCNQRTGAVLATNVEAAFDSRSRNRGLLGRDRLDEGSALVLAPCNSIHTFFMRFPIDVIFVARDGCVVKTASRVGPWRIRLALRAFATIELPAGTFERIDVRCGDVLVVSAGVRAGS